MSFTKYHRYGFLLVSGIANEALMTLYYSVYAPAGDKWACVAIGLAQQLVQAGMMWLNLVEAQSTRERLVRWAVTAASYGLAAAIIVG